MFGSLKNAVARAGGMGQVEEDQFMQQGLRIAKGKSDECGCELEILRPWNLESQAVVDADGSERG